MTNYTFDTIGQIPTMGTGQGSNKKKEEYAQLIAPTLQMMRGQYVEAGCVSRKVRSWCYTLEQAGLIEKADFDSIGDQITNWRLWGLMPIEWVSEDESRSIQRDYYSLINNDITAQDAVLAKLLELKKQQAPIHQPLSPWADQERYIIIASEKSDVAEMLATALPNYVPWMGLGGQPDIHSRVALLQLAADAIDEGKIPTIIYVGDHDLGGYKIAGGMMGDTPVTKVDNKKRVPAGYLENVRECELAADCLGITDQIEFQRVGINLDWCEQNGIKLIDNLITTGKKCLSDPTHKGHNDIMNQAYIRQFGVRKAECNALFAQPAAARAWIQDIFWQYADRDAHNAWLAGNAEQQQLANKLWQKYNEQLHAAIDNIIKEI
jgi:hypothetical protein